MKVFMKKIKIIKLKKILNKVRMFLRVISLNMIKIQDIIQFNQIIEFLRKFKMSVMIHLYTLRILILQLNHKTIKIIQCLSILVLLQTLVMVYWKNNLINPERHRIRKSKIKIRIKHSKMVCINFIIKRKHFSINRKK